MGPPIVAFTRKVTADPVVKSERERLRREDHRRVKHDKLFSNWKVLVGPSDWISHAAGEEGSQRYRLHNLPATYFGPGVYELGLLLHTSLAAQELKPRKLRRQDVIVVYLGQADNVRQRLQRYGQSGSHLEGARLVPELAIEERGFEPRKTRASMDPGTQIASKESSCAQGGLRLFTEVFSKGYSIVFRWARTESKQMAETVESELLRVFDYPWNREMNGVRRPEDILAKLDLLQYQFEKSLCVGRGMGFSSRSWELFGRKVGIAVAARKPIEDVNLSVKASKFSIFLSTTRAPPEGHQTESRGPICGVPLDNGSLCRSEPVKGRRRCSAHKGRRTQLSTRRSRAATDRIDTRNSQVPIPSANVRTRIAEAASGDESKCGVPLEDGSSCARAPVKGRKRCPAHKGMRTATPSPCEPKAVHSHHTPRIPIPAPPNSRVR